MPATIAGTITATNGGAPVAAATVGVAGSSTTSDAAGRFSLTSSPSSSSLPVTISGAHLVERKTNVNVQGSRSIDFDAIVQSGGFDLGFYRQLARNGFEAPQQLQPLRRLTRTPRIYLKTMDDAGSPIDPRVLDQVEAAMTDIVPRLTGSALGAPAVTRGGDSREGVAGWITVGFLATDTSAQGFCGQTQIGTDTAFIRFGYLTPRCRVGGFVIAPTTIRHETGHALGFFHTDNPLDLMWGGTWIDPGKQPTARELYHAAIAYKRAIGNMDPDTDAAGTVNLAPMTVR